MKSTGWRELAELIGILAIVASLIFVGFQLKQDRDVALAESMQSAESSYSESNAMIAEYADVWLKGRNDEELPDAEWVVMNRIVATLYRRARNTAVMRRDLDKPGTEPIKDFAISLYENAGARRAWEFFDG